MMTSLHSKLSLYRDRIQQIAEAYEAAPEYDERAVQAWQELAQDSAQRAAALRQQFNTRVTDDPEPYPDAHAMFEDLNRGNFIVSRANSEHPIWTPEQNVDFRIAHDILGHYPTGGDFSWGGENEACNNHARDLSPLARQALMTECLGQTGYAIHNGGFGDQKVAFLQGLDEFDEQDPWSWQDLRTSSYGDNPACCYRNRWAGGWPPAEEEAKPNSVHSSVGFYRESLVTQEMMDELAEEAEREDKEKVRRVEEPELSDYPNHKQWLVNVGKSDTPGTFEHSVRLSEDLREWLMENHPSIIAPVTPGQGMWEGDPEPHTQIHFINVDREKLEEVLREYGAANPEEYAFGIIPVGAGEANSILWDNPYQGHPPVIPGQMSIFDPPYGSPSSKDDNQLSLF